MDSANAILEIIFYPPFYITMWYFTFMYFMLGVFWHDPNLKKLYRREMYASDCMAFSGKITACILLWGTVALPWIAYMPVFIFIKLAVHFAEQRSSLSEVQTTVTVESTNEETVPGSSKKKKF